MLVGVLVTTQVDSAAIDLITADSGRVEVVLDRSHEYRLAWDDDSARWLVYIR